MWIIRYQRSELFMSTDRHSHWKLVFWFSIVNKLSVNIRHQSYGC